MKRLYIIVGIFVLIILVFSFFVFKGKQIETQKVKKTLTKVDILNNLKQKLEQKYIDTYPLPKGNLVLLDKNLKQIHLEDYNVDLDSVKDLYIVQGNTCFLKDINGFEDLYYDKEFTIGENKKCFSYAVTKDRKKYQIGAVIYKNGKYVTYLVGNISGSIIKDIYSNNLVINGSDQYLPYLPAYNNKFFVKTKYGSGKLYFTYGGFKKEYDLSILKNGKYLPEKLINGLKGIDIKIEGDNFLVEIVYPDGNISYLKGSENNPVGISIENYEYNGVNSNISIVNKLGEIAYNMVKFSNDSSSTMKDNFGNVLTIRGTKFNLKVLSDEVNYYLEEGKIELEDLKNYSKYFLDRANKLVGLLQDGRVLDVLKMKDRVKALLSYSIGVNTLIEPKEEFEIDGLDYSLNKKNIEKYIEKEKIDTSDLLDSFTGSNIDIIGVDGTNNLGLTNKYFFVKFSGNVLKLSSLLVKFNQYKKQCIKQGNCKSFYLREELNNLCKNAGYNVSISKGEIYKFFNLNSLTDTGIFFDIVSSLNIDISTTPVLFNDGFGKKGDSLSVLYYHPIKKTFVYGYPYDPNYSFNGFYIVCK